MAETKSIRHARNFQDLTGQVFGRWTVLRRDTARTHRLYWICRCECGTERSVVASGLKAKNTHASRSCGCLQKELTRVRNTRHGMASIPEYRVWTAMIGRCRSEKNTAFHNYGGRGISVCQRWGASFAAFISDMGRRPTSKHTLDRVNNDGNYELGNCEWRTRTQQSRNRRDSRMITFNSQTLHVFDWADKLGITHRALSARIYEYGWTVERAFAVR